MSAWINTRWVARGRTILDRRDPVPKVMGIVNLTADSFSDGGRFQDPLEAVRFAHRLAELGADLLDLGAESIKPEQSRSFSSTKWLGLFWRFVSSDRVEIPISVDTTKGNVARAALAGGASPSTTSSALAS